MFRLTLGVTEAIQATSIYGNEYYVCQLGIAIESSDIRSFLLLRTVCSAKRTNITVTP